MTGWFCVRSIIDATFAASATASDSETTKEKERKSGLGICSSAFWSEILNVDNKLKYSKTKGMSS
jgi:hypothetical protein